MLAVLPTASHDFDMALGRRRSLMTVWALEIVYFPSSWIPWYLIVSSYGYPRVPLAEAVQENPSILFESSVANVFALNVVDAVSVAIYVKLVWKLQSASVHPGDVQDVESSDGIFVGGMDNNVPGPPPPPPLPPPQQQSDSNHATQNVLRVLKWHVMLSLIDITQLLISLAFCTELGKFFAPLYQIFCYYYLPYFVIKHNFKQLKGRNLKSLMCYSCNSED